MELLSQVTGTRPEDQLLDLEEQEAEHPCRFCGHEKHHYKHTCHVPVPNIHGRCECSRRCGRTDGHCGKTPCGVSYTHERGQEVVCPCVRCVCEACQPVIECGCRDCACARCAAQRGTIRNPCLLAFLLCFLGLSLCITSVTMVTLNISKEWRIIATVGMMASGVLLMLGSTFGLMCGALIVRPLMRNQYDYLNRWEGWLESPHPDAGDPSE